MNSVPKSDKKKRKQLLWDVTEMEQKHRQELGKFQDNSNLDSVAEDLAKMDLENQPPRLFKARKKGGPGEGAQERIFQAEMQHLASLRREEEEKLVVFLGARNLEMKDIPAERQVCAAPSKTSCCSPCPRRACAGRTANYTQRHIDSLLPFFSNPGTGDAYGGDDFMSYCNYTVLSAS
nr:OTU domain-containing protein 6A-like [Pongo abelii]